MEDEKRLIGVFFEINGNKYVTEIDYRSKGKFRKLLEDFSKNAKIYHPMDSEEFQFIPLCDILDSAYENLEEKQRANKLVINLMAQNSCKPIHFHN